MLKIVARPRFSPFGCPTAVLVFALAGVVHGENRTILKALESIKRDQLRSHVAVLADDTFEGREAGSRGGYAAGGYIVKHLQALNLKPAGENGSYYQSIGASGRNILALLEGSDPKLKEEVVIVGGHYDHVGYGTRRNSYGPWGYIHNGADDNASGTSALLEVAEALRKLPQPPRRSILLAFWDGEEKGLIGSTHWVTHPTVSWDRLKCFINVDMIGRLANRKVEVYGSRTAPGLRQLVSQSNMEALDLDFTWQMKNDSDHWPFFAKGLPTLMLHTGLHGDYHRPSDDVERLNHEGLEQVSRLLFETTYVLATIDSLGKFRPESKRETDDVRRAYEQPGNGPIARLGMTWHKEVVENAVSLRLLSVTRGSAAEQAGLRVGDVVSQLNGMPIEDDILFRQQVLASKEPISLKVERSGAVPQLVRVTLHGAPVRVGVTTREDAAEPGIVTVSYVVYGSPAALAGLQVNDRIEAVDGRAFANDAEFTHLLVQAKDQATLRYERRGVIREATLKLLFD